MIRESEAPIIDFSQRHPDVHPATFVAEGARLIGLIIFEEGASVWYNPKLPIGISKE